MRVWLDDIRPAPPGWRRCYTPAEVIELLQTDEVTEVSLDHDLGLTDGTREQTGYDVLLWIATTGRRRSLPAAGHQRPLGQLRCIAADWRRSTRLSGCELEMSPRVSTAELWCPPKVSGEHRSAPRAGHPLRDLALDRFDAARDLL